MNLKQQVADLMTANRRVSGSHQYTLPSPDSYPYQWLWDSCFHAIILSHFDLNAAKKELISLTRRQFENGMIPHMIYWEHPKDKSKFPVIHWGLRNTSTLTQPPLLAYAVWQIFRKDKDTEFLKKMYPSMKKFYEYFLKDRDTRHNHLAAIINPDESGEDNSPRFDLPLGLPKVQTIDENFETRKMLYKKNKVCKFDASKCMYDQFWVKDVPFNAILVENLKNMADIALELHEDIDADYFLHQSKLTSYAMQILMKEDDLYWSTMGPRYERIKVKTWALFSPLFANILTRDEAKKLVKEHLLNPNEFKTKYGVPTTALSEKSFDPNGFWRGPVWMSTNWFIYKGLKKYKLEKEAQMIKAQSLELLEKSGFREQFNPLTGEGYGAHDFTWGGLVLDMN